MVGIGYFLSCEESLHDYADAGYDEVHVQQIGPDQEAFFEFRQREIAPNAR